MQYLRCDSFYPRAESSKGLLQLSREICRGMRHCLTKRQFSLILSCSQSRSASHGRRPHLLPKNKAKLRTKNASRPVQFETMTQGVSVTIKDVRPISS
jgi:hypothetical protein